MENPKMVVSLDKTYFRYALQDQYSLQVIEDLYDSKKIWMTLSKPKNITFSSK